VGKHQTRWTGFDDKIISLYARGLSVREIQSHLEEIYGAEVSPSLISSVTDAVSEDVKLWQARPLDELYPILYLDCIHVKVCDSGAVRNKAVYLAIGVNMTGHKEVLGLWIAQTEGAKFRLQVVTELKNRGVQDIFIACVDGLKGFPDAIEAVYPKEAIQLCIVHMVRNSLNFVSWKVRKEVATDLKGVLFDLNTGVRDDVVCNLQWSWEIPVRQLGISVFVVPAAHVKGVVGKKTDMVLVCNSVAQSIVERQRGKHATHVFTYRRERVKNKDRPPVMPYRPIQTMNNTAWQNAREKAGLGDLHVHDLRHTVGLRLREAGISDRTQDAILWHSCKTMTAHYSMAQLVEVFEALEKIKDEANRWNISLTSLIHEANVERLTQKSPTQRQTG
jgi:hypothetical protein